MSKSTQQVRDRYLVSCVSLVALSMASVATAQTARDPGALEEVVVTATRQAGTVNSVPLSVSAVTQRSIDERGIKTVQDLSRTVPALTISPGNNGALNNITIRGIYSNAGAPTTAVYLDDTQLTKRNEAGPSQVSNGTPVPPLFDLERVEVLRGPQGTLYGGSSEGGTIRFITPTPSLTSYSMYTRSEVATTDGGDLSYEEGVAAGGPIVRDKLAFRASAFGRHTGGYIDSYHPFERRVVKENINTVDVTALRGVLLLAPTEMSRVTLSYYRANEDSADSSAFNLPTGAFSTAQLCFNTAAPFPTATKAVPCPATASPGKTVNNIYMRPAQTYGPYPELGPFKTLSRTGAPAQTLTETGALTLDYALPGMTMKSITSYIHDDTYNDVWESLGVSTGNGVINAPGGVNAVGGLGLYAGLPDYPTARPGHGPFRNWNRRVGLTQELRFASDSTARPVSWVAGLYYSNIRGTGFYENVADYAAGTTALYGITMTQRYGVEETASGSIATRYQALKDVEIAAFAEGNWHVTEKLTAIGGLRSSRVSNSFYQTFFGALNGFLVPTTANGGLTIGSTAESPLTPKLGLQYALAEDRMVYVNAAEGYRPGGVNSPLPPAICVGLAQQGLTPLDVPGTYNSDTVWSYEAGTKLRLLGNRVQMNASAFRIDWSNVQVAIATVGCAPTYVMNAGAARSQGYDMDLQARLFRGLTAYLTLGYTDAKYTQDALGPTPRIAGVLPSKAVNQGDTLPVPPWSVSLGLQYSFSISGRWDAYLRGDYQYASAYYRGPGAGVNSYAPDIRDADAVDQLNLRAGVGLGRWALNIFATNALNSRDLLSESGGRSGCSIASGASCSAYTQYNPMYTAVTFRPRTIGMQAAYRY